MLLSVFQGMTPTKVKTKSIKVMNLDTARARGTRSHGFYTKLKKLPTSATIVQLHVYFNAGRNVLIMPRTRLLPKPTPRDIENPHNAEYSRWMFHRETWAEEILSATEFAAYSGPLLPAARWRWDDPLAQWIIPYVAGRDAWTNPAAGIAAVNGVSMYVFEIPDTKLVDAKAPANAAGPYELIEQTNGTCLFLCYLRSMSAKQKNKYQAMLFDKQLSEA